MEVELEEEIEEKNGDVFEEVVVEADNGEVLSLDTNHPPSSNEYLGLSITYHEPPTFFPIPPPPKTLKPNFYQSISELFLKAPNSTLRAFQELVQNKSKKSLMSSFKINKGKDQKKVSKIRRDLFAWLIVF